MENLGIPRNHISQLMGHEDSNMALDVYSSGLAEKTCFSQNITLQELINGQNYLDLLQMMLVMKL